ncbi:sigma-70 family RNA polymerase sigma factor [Chitinophagaceae bacterium LB-8]|uniref:Sigma-70 family RNA polymerase sigma factor n=1 Tax=Paraflavisolibacter caeni TaxID=2982496 RepID=A0A9X3BHM3_9BACT|nr:sigma-70 family RNA polymerase sigma factor [Paraflavisolibacter caeni]MCU7552564.1 sigma-70 family RNA polymerase sigma factor [Paraflavisolibacter caeni]
MDLTLENYHTESLLLRQLSQGSAAAFDELYYRYYEPVRLNILKITRDDAVTDDILQEVFICLWEKREKFASYEKISGWLFVTSHNCALNYLRNLSVERLRQKTLAKVDEMTHWPLEDAYQEMQLRLLEEAIAQLPPHRRRVFELCRFQGKSYDETATELAISKNTVKDHLARARETIHSYMQFHTQGMQKKIALLLVIILGDHFF